MLGNCRALRWFGTAVLGLVLPSICALASPSADYPVAAPFRDY